MEWITVVRRLDLGVSPVWPWPVALYPLWLGLFIFKVVLKRGQTSQGSLRIEWSSAWHLVMHRRWSIQQRIRQVLQRGTEHSQGRATRQGNSSDSHLCAHRKKKRKTFSNMVLWGKWGMVSMGCAGHDLEVVWSHSSLFSLCTPLIPPTLPPTALSWTQCPGSRDAGDPSRGGPRLGSAAEAGRAACVTTRLRL